MEKNILYDELVLTITNILKEENLENKLKPYNFNEDKKILHNFFLKPILNLNNNNLDLNWDNQKWIESMKYIRLGLLSFLYKNNATLYKVYSLIKDDEIKSHILLEKYKNLINNIIMIEKMSLANKFLLEENILLDDLQNKNYYLFLNLKNITEPKYLSYLIDILSHKEYRKTILKYIIDGTEKIDLKKLIESKEINSYEFVESFLHNMSKNNIYHKLIKFIMCLNFNGEILMKKEIYNKTQIYINQMINNSSILTKFFDDINNEYKTQKNITKFKSDIKIVYLPENITFTSKRDMKKKDIETYKDFYNQKKHINLYNINYDKFYKDIFVDNKNFYFCKTDIIQRILDIVSLLIENITIHYFESKEEKINCINSFFANNELFKKFNIDLKNKNELVEILKNIKENGLVENDNNTQETYDNKTILKELLEKIKNSVKNDENINYFYNLIIDFIFIFKNLDKIDISSIDKKDFNICFDLVNKLTEDISKLKTFIFHIVEKDNFALLLSFIEKKNILKINKNLKEKIVEIILKTILEIVNIIKTDDDEKTKTFIKFLCVLAKGIDYVFFYLKKLKQKQNEKINKKENIKKQIIYK